MARKWRTAPTNGGSRPLDAAVVGTGRLPEPVRDSLTHADPAPLRAVPKDHAFEGALARVESLLGRGQFGAALREAEELKGGGRDLAGRYAFLRQEKVSRAQIGIAERYVARGDQGSAKRFYELALSPDGADSAVSEIVSLAGKAFDDLLDRRRELIQGLRTDIQANEFTEWCGR